jgi:monoamine oxidase
VHPFGRPLLVLHVAGRVGRALEVQGEAAMREAGLEIAAHAFGSDLRRRVRKVEVTRWGSDPWSRGSYSVCRPGQAHARKTLAEPVGDRLLFAGEHTSSDSFGTVHGAHLSGEAAAGRALGLLGA